MILACRGVSIDYGPVRAVASVDLEVLEGEVLALLGPSGSGKTSLLFAIAGFLPISEGQIEMGGKVVATPRRSIPPEARSVGMVFQNYALWPHLDAVDTVAYPFRRAGLDKPEARRRGRELLDNMEIGDLARRRPGAMSGGQQQRLGLARALARNPSLYLFDEPTAHLDAGVRQSIQEEVAWRRRESGATAIYSTHDSGEALAVADRVAVLRRGTLAQVAAPREIYEQPADLEIATLTGPASVIAGEIDDFRRGLLDGVTLPVTGSLTPGPASLLIRPEWITPDADEGLAGKVVALWYRGPHTDYRIATDASNLIVRIPGPPQFRLGDRSVWRVSRAHALA
jgi:ABC-type Fe3+/spermidine/putrescine transport system ATPase subunit